MTPWLLNTALRSLRRTPLRSSLTALGLIIGVAAVLTTNSIGNGAKARIEEILARPDSRALTISAISLRGPDRIRVMPARPDQLSTNDYGGLRRLPGVTAATPQMSVGKAQIRANGRATEAVVGGYDVDGLSIEGRTLLDGELFSRTDVRLAASVCLITQWLADVLFPNSIAIKRTVLIDGAAFTIIGVLGSDPFRDLGPLTKDIFVYVPYTTLRQRLNPNASMNVYLQALNPGVVDELAMQASTYMEHHRAGRRAEFIYHSGLNDISEYNRGADVMARLILAIGAVAFTVGGVGIMNIMLIGVAERTREIGIRMALGTRATHVLGQFMAEAVILSASGGLAGLCIGTASSILISGWNNWSTRLTLSGALSALLCSVAVGIFFGYYPARKAASLHPATSLRTE